MSLNNVADIAYFSPFHFHRIFKEITGETLKEFITRRRIEKSVSFILHKKKSISELSHTFGFSDNSAFTKAFKKYYGVSPTEFKIQNHNVFFKIKPLISKIGQDYPDLDQYICIINNHKKWINMNSRIIVKEIQEQNYVYITCIGPQELPLAFQKLIGWVTQNGLMTQEAKFMVVYKNSLKITEEDKALFRACFQIKDKVENEFDFDKIPSGKYLIGSFEIIKDDFEKSWTGLYIWMKDNGYERNVGDSFEIYHNNLNEHPENKAIVDFYIPIK